MFSDILEVYARLFEVVFDDLYQRWKLANPDTKTFRVVFRESIALNTATKHRGCICKGPYQQEHP